LAGRLEALDASYDWCVVNDLFVLFATNTRSGSAASFILMILPPQSARKAVRRGSAKTLTSLSNIYASLMSAWITDIPSSKELKSGLSVRASSFRKDLAAVALQLESLRETARWARWEGNVRGRWPYEEYNRVVDVQLEMVAVLAQVSRISIQVPFS
jgi:hypothetical protein